MLRLSVSNRVEPAHAHDLANRLAAAVIRIRVGPKDTAEVGLEP